MAEKAPRRVPSNRPRSSGGSARKMSWREAVVSSLTASEVAELLAAVPVVTRTLLFPDPMPDHIRELPEVLRNRMYLEPVVPTSTLDLVAAIAAPATIDDIMRGLGLTEQRLLLEGAWRGGSLELDQLLDEWIAGGHGSIAGMPDRRQLEVALTRLRMCLLVLPEQSGMPWMQIAPDTLLRVGLPGRSAAEGFAYAVSDELLATLTAVGVKDPPRLRDERAALLVKLLRDRTHLERVLSTLSSESRGVFDFLMGMPGPVDPFRLGLSSAVSLDRRHRRNAHLAEGRPLYELYDVGWIGVDVYERDVWLWREVVQAVRPRLVTDWSTPRIPATLPLGSVERRSAMAVPLSLFSRVLDEWKSQPPTALADGGLGVGPVRALAKRLKASSAHVGLIAHLAIQLKLLDSSVTGTEGRGRNMRNLYSWKLTSAVESWNELAPVDRWRAMVSQWLGDRRLDDVTGLPERWSFSYVDVDVLPRQLMLRELEALPEGVGFDADLCGNWMWSMHPSLFLSVDHAAAVIDALRSLGLVPSTGPVGLTDEARKLLGSEAGAGPADAGDWFEPEGGSTVFVQADRTVTVLPEAPIDARLLLDRIAELESDAGARVYRLTESSVRTSLEGGLHVETIVDELSRLSGRPVAQPIIELLRDVDRTRGRVTIAAANTVIVSDDPVMIVSAVRVKAAKLRALGPYTAVSTLAPDKVRSLLAAKEVFVTFDAESEGDSPPSGVTSRLADRVGQAERSVEWPRPLGYIGVAKVAEVASRLQGEK
jgi:hypothetical protein